MKTNLDYDITPLGMLNNSKIWYGLYRQNINLGTAEKVIAIYCLLIGLEMYLKSYLILLNKEKYSFDSELQSLGHKFENVLNAIKKEKDPKLLGQIVTLVEKYDLLLIDTNSLRYPKKGDTFLRHDNYLKSYNEFDDLFDAITSEVSLGIVNKFYAK
ncbi:MAG: hypothetical protein Q7S88_01190 [Candidatus Daviesbacteria bacterium]|nr:hypothetical protein [Candidatus Daviesbacteria bacterium]